MSSDQELNCRSGSDKYVLTVENIPNCNIWEMEPVMPLKMDSRIPVYLIPPVNTPAISFERNRCVKFIDSNSETYNKISEETLKVLSTLRK
jgi:hypothetical protein